MLASAAPKPLKGIFALSSLALVTEPSTNSGVSMALLAILLLIIAPSAISMAISLKSALIGCPMIVMVPDELSVPVPVTWERSTFKDPFNAWISPTPATLSLNLLAVIEASWMSEKPLMEESTILSPVISPTSKL